MQTGKANGAIFTSVDSGEKKIPTIFRLRLDSRPNESNNRAGPSNEFEKVSSLRASN